MSEGSNRLRREGPSHGVSDEVTAPFGWLSREHGPWEPTDRDGWMAAEREAGFNAPVGRPATAGFASLGGGVRGRLFDPTKVPWGEERDAL